MRCDGCGADLDELLTECAYCGTKIPTEPNLEEETRVLLEALESRLQEAVASRTDVWLIGVFLLFLASGPACYWLLASYTEAGLLARLFASLLMAVLGFTVFGWQCLAQEEKAEQIAWRDMIGPEVRRFTDRKELANTEFMVLARRLSGDESRLWKVISKWFLG